MQNNISVIIHTHNEEAHIKACIESARLLTDLIVVVDMESTDNTVAYAQEMNVQIVSFPFSYYVEPARAFGIQQVKTPWLFILDADERMTPELATEIKQIASQDNLAATHYRIPRKNIFATKWLQHGGWWPDAQIRMIHTTSFSSWPTKIHSTPVINGTVGYTNNAILHLFHGNLATMVDKTIVYENIESDLLFQANKPVATSTFFRKFFGELFRRMFKKLGFMDGTYGVIESMYQAFSKTITYLYLYEKKNSRPL